MTRLFADAVYWIAIANHKDQWHAKVVKVMRSLGQASLVTTEEVLDEFLTYYSAHGPILRNNAAQTVEDALADPLVIVRPQTHQSFLDGLALYKARADKEYSLTDCISMVTMRQLGITETLTHDIISRRKDSPPCFEHAWARFNDGRFRVTTEAKLRPLARFGCSMVSRLISAFRAVRQPAEGGAPTNRDLKDC